MCNFRLVRFHFHPHNLHKQTTGKLRNKNNCLALAVYQARLSLGGSVMIANRIGHNDAQMG